MNEEIDLILRRGGKGQKEDATEALDRVYEQETPVQRLHTPPQSIFYKTGFVEYKMGRLSSHGDREA